MSHIKLSPLPPGFTARHATFDDAEMAAELGRAYALETTGLSDMDAGQILAFWQASGFDPARDVYFVFDPHGTPAGYTEVHAMSDPPVHPFVWGMVPAAFQGRGIGTHMLAWAENRVLQTLERVPDGLRVAPTASCASTVTSAKSLFESNGWKHIRSSYTMRIDLEDAPPPAPDIPPGIVIRTYQPGDAAAIYRASSEAFQDHFGHVTEPFEAGLARFQKTRLDDPMFDGSLWFLAMDGDEIAATCLCRKESWNDPQAGQVGTLGVRRPWRKRGLGLALLRLAFGAFHRRGIRKVDLGVDALNITGALRLYEKAGMHIIQQYDQYEKELRPGRELRTEG